MLKMFLTALLIAYAFAIAGVGCGVLYKINHPTYQESVE